MKNIKTNWDLSLLYKNEKDPKIESDLKTAEAAYDAFGKKYSTSTDYVKSETLFAQALADYESLYEVPAFKALAYFRYRSDMNANDSVARAELNLLSQRANKNANKIVFFHVALSRIPKAQQEKYVKSDMLKFYRYFLKCIFDQSEHTLSEPEEKILNLMSLPGYALWVQGNEKIVSNQTVLWKGKKLPINEAMSTIAVLPLQERRKLGRDLYKKLREISEFAENELNALVINKKIEDELRGYKKPYSATVLGYQNELVTVENLVATVTRHFPMAHRFYKLKAKMLGLKKLNYVDRNTEVGKTKKKIPFEKGVEMVRAAFLKFGAEYAGIFDSFLTSGQIDVFPKVGKRGGAYCSTDPKTPTFVMLNHLPDFHSVNTMAHEMGHAFHAKFSRENQKPLYQDHTISTAEVASTLFENFVFDEVFSSLSKKEQIVALHDKIMGSINSIFRQIACFNFELELHNTIRVKGNLPKEEIARIMNQHMASYLGPLFNMQENEGYSFVYWSHLRNFFYVYSYAFGEIISSALYQMYKKDNSFKDKIKQFLSSGGSDSPENIFKSIGIDVRKPGFFEEGLNKIEKDIDILEELLKNT